MPSEKFYLSVISEVRLVSIRGVFVLPAAESTACWVEEGRRTMVKRQQTIVCMFDFSSTRISAYEIHELIFDQLHVPEQALKMVQIDGTKRQVYLKLIDDTYATKILHNTKGHFEYKHTTGDISVDRLEMAGMGTCRIRIANLPPETSERAIRMPLAPYGEIVTLHDEVWSKMCRHSVANGIRVAKMKLAKHLHSHVVTTGDRVVLSYEGQPVSCYACGRTCHMQQTCPHRRREEQPSLPATDNPWAKVAATGKPIQRNSEEVKEETNSLGAEGAQIQFQSLNEMAQFDQRDVTTFEETQEAPAVQREVGTRRQGKEDWAALVTAHTEDRAGDMDLSPENLSEIE